MSKLQVFYGNCLDIMPKLEKESIHLVVTSPPYSSKKEYGKYEDNVSFEEYYDFMLKVFDNLYRLLVDGGRVAFNIPFYLPAGNSKYFAPTIYNEFAVKSGLELRDVIVWIKAKEDIESENDIISLGKTNWGSWMSASNPCQRSLSELIMIWNKGSPYLKSDIKSDMTKEEFMKWTKNTWYIKAASKKENDHPAPFPVEIPKRLIKLYSFPLNTVLDPFLGSGTTLLACRETNRNGIGIELDEKWKNTIENKVKLNISGLEEFK